MNQITRREGLDIPGPVGRLEAMMDVPHDIRGVAVVCHPHPLHGGTMHNKVAHTLARSFARASLVALRFNFRGTEGSEGRHDNGEGEVEDVLAAYDWIRNEYPDLPVWLAGFSFGAAMAIRAAAVADVAGLVSVAPATSRFASGMAVQPRCPWLVIQGDLDELVEIDQTVAWLDSLEPGPELLVLSGAEHFFHGRLNELGEAVIEFVQRQPPP